MQVVLLLEFVVKCFNPVDPLQCQAWMPPLSYKYLLVKLTPPSIKDGSSSDMFKMLSINFSVPTNVNNTDTIRLDYTNVRTLK